MAPTHSWADNDRFYAGIPLHLSSSMKPDIPSACIDTANETLPHIFMMAAKICNTHLHSINNAQKALPTKFTQ
jgi:hypothetical protein